jgi:hypothetical protein
MGVREELADVICPFLGELFSSYDSSNLKGCRGKSTLLNGERGCEGDSTAFG